MNYCVKCDILFCVHIILTQLKFTKIKSSLNKVKSNYFIGEVKIIINK